MSARPDSLFDTLGVKSVESKKLTLLSFGAGQDSTTLLLMYIHDETFRKTFAPDGLIVVFSDTGDEHDHTYEHLENVKALCRIHGIEIVHIVPEMGYHGKGWHSLRGQYNLNGSVGSKAFVKSCSDKLKIKPIYNFLEDYIADRYTLPRGRKRAHKAFAKLYGKVQVLIGIAAGEEKRVATGFEEEWKKQSLHNVYPLIQMGMGRTACQEYNRKYLDYEVMPSNCILCPWMSLQELLYMFRFMRDDYEAWVAIEQRKFEKHADKGEKNLGVWGKWIKEENRPYTLRDALAAAEKQFGHWTDDDLRAYKMNHGCVGSKY
ncbi:adenine nucleotide alpha hydrolase family protein [Thiomicrolovo sp. ZZH C-3]